MSDLLARMGDLPEDSPEGDATSLSDEAKALLVRTSEPTARCGLVLARGR